MAKKIFVGSLPDNVQEDALQDVFGQYGRVEDIYVKQNCERGRQWAFVTFATHEEALSAKEACDRNLTMPGCDRPCDVMMAKNQGMYGQDSQDRGSQGRGSQVSYQSAPQHAPQQASASAPRKCFVGSLPDGVQESTVRAEFNRYGQVTDVFLKPNCEPGRQWGFVTFAQPHEAQSAKDACDRILRLPGSDRPCEVTLARNQGLYGQESREQSGYHQAPAPAQTWQPAPAPVAADGPKKIFVGSLPDGITEVPLRAEFSKYGHVVDVHVKEGCEPGRQWAFVTFADPQQATLAKEYTDRVLTFPGSEKACEVMLARNQGKYGQQSTSGQSNGGTSYTQYSPAPAQAGVGAAPPPPTAPPPAHLTPWRMYKTVAGLPYYHNSQTGVTQWECPPDLQAAAEAPHSRRYAPY